MYNFLLEMIFMSSLGIMIYLFGRALPRVNESQKNGLVDVFRGFINKIPLEKIDSTLNKVFEKILRRIRVFILRIDNLVSSLLGRVKETHKSESENQATLFEHKKSDN